MNNKDILSVLNSHKKITEVTLGKQTDCTEFFDNFVAKVYQNSRLEGIGLDSVLREELWRFKEVDSLEIVNGKGKFLKRFASFYKKETTKQLSDEVMGIIGDILQQFVNGKTESDFHIDFTDKIDWKDGEFGKSGSCWWGTYAGSIPTFQNNGGWCVRFYNKNNVGIGRTWLYPYQGTLLGFNAYGVERPSVSKVLKQVFKEHGFELHYKSCGITNEQNSDIPYVNSGTGFVLYSKEDESSLESDYDLDMEPESCNVCRECGSLGDDDFIYHDDYWYCPDCYDENFSSCDKCGDTYDHDEVFEISGYRSYSYVCENCAKNLGYAKCSSCENFHMNCIESTDGNLFCEDCNECFYCETCDIYIEKADECKTCVEREELEEDEDLKFTTGNITVSSGAVIKNTEIVSHSEYPGIVVYKENGGYGILHINTGKRIYNISIHGKISSLKNAVTYLEMFGKLGDWNSWKTEEDITSNLDIEATKSLVRYISGRE